MHRFLCLSIAAGLALAGSARAGMDCQSIGGGQFYDQLTYCVSSVLPNQSGNSYGVANLIDGNLATAWCEGAAGHGIGQQIVIEISGGTEFDHFFISNGYQKSRKSFERNSRPRELRIRSWDGLDTVAVLPDEMGEFRVTLPRAARYSQLVIEVQSVYPGSKWPDTCISELYLDFEALNYRPAPPASGGGGGISIGGGSPGFGSFPKLKN